MLPFYAFNVLSIREASATFCFILYYVTDGYVLILGFLTSCRVREFLSLYGNSFCCFLDYMNYGSLYWIHKAQSHIYENLICETSTKVLICFINRAEWGGSKDSPIRARQKRAPGRVNSWSLHSRAYLAKLTHSKQM